MRTIEDDKFDRRKQHILTELASATRDRSPKGFPDYRVLPLLDHINQLKDYVTTSSCSGRVVVYRDKVDVDDEEKKGGGWLLVSHDPVPVPPSNDELAHVMFGKNLTRPQLSVGGSCVPHTENEVENGSDSALVYVRFEPFILHVQARTLEKARVFLRAALNAGFKHSGMVTTNKRNIVSVRGNLRLDAPVGTWRPPLKTENNGVSVTPNDGSEGTVDLIVTYRYLRLLLNLCNEKFMANGTQMQKFLGLLTGTPWETSAETEPDKTESKEERRARKKLEGMRVGSMNRKADKEPVNADGGDGDEADGHVQGLYGIE
eukprot:comp62930_c0_seq1/m.47929 comp62930_c0_seq1/g.47929  ORF comp62930_c0_seq1/g.47929 comp62930_c0_seq1/m.47929 type:complete len:317 (-) comp62930_c0_seq1:224-1174(-)